MKIAPTDTARRYGCAVLRRTHLSWYALFVLWGLAAGGCGPGVHSTIATVGGAEEGARLDAAPDDVRIAALTSEIAGLSPKVDKNEAAQTARRAILYARLLAETYHVTQPVELNNVLINAGLHKRGLCFQLADDLCAELKSMHLRTLRFDRATAWWDDVWKEHNCVVVRSPGQSFENGLVLDPWRNSPVLRWSVVKKDWYPWQLRQPEEGLPGLQSGGIGRGKQ